jgi:hypothetical protein
MTRSTSSRGKGTAIAAALLLVPIIVAAVVHHERIGHWLRWGDPWPLEPHLERLLAWFPEDIQTLMVVRDAVIRSRSSPLDRKSPGALDQAQAWTSELLFNIGKGALAAELEGRRLALGIEGSRTFRSPSGLGLMPFAGCQVLVFDGDLGPAGDRLMAQALRSSKRPLSLGKHPVAVLEERLEDDTWTFFLTRISSNALLLATDEGFLEEVLRRRQERPAGRALPDELPEWREIDRTAPFWALRHYDRGDAAADPSSPFGGRKAANCPDEGAVGVAFCLVPVSASSGPRARLVYFFGEPRSGEHPRAVLESTAGAIEGGDAAPLREGVLEVLAGLRRLGVQAPVLALADQLMKGDRERCLEVGFTACLPRTANGPDLLPTVAALLEKEGKRVAALASRHSAIR